MSQHADKIRTAVAQGGSASAITASWRRCITMYGLDPDHSEAPRQDTAGLQQALLCDSDLVDITRPCLDQLFALLGAADCAVILADRGGLVLDLRTNRKVDAWQRGPRQWLGTCYLEEALGTNSVGTCLAEQRAIIIRGHQHFLARYTNRVGISAPLYGPHGELVGCLNLNQDTQSHDARLDSFLSNSVSNFARRIETELFARAHPATRLILASPRGLRPDALLAVDPDDRVIGATRGARRLHALDNRALALKPNVDEMLARPAASDALAEVERRAIFRALARCGGNHSAAAKVVGISRSTLYRKLRSYEVVPSPAETASALKLRSSA